MIQIAYDDNFKEMNGQPYLSYVMSHAQARLCHHSLGHKYKLHYQGERHVAGQRWTNNHLTLNKLFGYTQSYVGNANIVIYFGKQSRACEGQATVCIGGECYTGSVCKRDKKMLAQINWFSHSYSDLGHGVAHELGHFLGAKDAQQGSGCYNGIMGGPSPTAQNTVSWSSCSRNQIQAHYTNLKYRWCLQGIEFSNFL